MAGPARPARRGGDGGGGGGGGGGDSVTTWALSDYLVPMTCTAMVRFFGDPSGPAGPSASTWGRRRRRRRVSTRRRACCEPARGPEAGGGGRGVVQVRADAAGIRVIIRVVSETVSRTVKGANGVGTHGWRRWQGWLWLFGWVGGGLAGGRTTMMFW
jgi:hypothetical protein